MDRETAIQAIKETFNLHLPPLVGIPENKPEAPRFWLTKYGKTRYWAVYDQGDLVAVTVYRKGGEEVLKRLSE